MWHDLNMVKERWHCDEARMVGDIGYGLREIPKRFVVIRRGNLWGLLYGEDLISDFQWLKVDTDDRLDHKHIMVCGEKGWGLMDTLGRIIIEPVYRRLGPSLENCIYRPLERSNIRFACELGESLDLQAAAGNTDATMARDNGLLPRAVSGIAAPAFLHIRLPTHRTTIQKEESGIPSGCRFLICGFLLKVDMGYNQYAMLYPYQRNPLPRKELIS